MIDTELLNPNKEDLRHTLARKTDMEDLISRNKDSFKRNIGMVKFASLMELISFSISLATGWSMFDVGLQSALITGIFILLRNHGKLKKINKELEDDHLPYITQRVGELEAQIKELEEIVYESAQAQRARD
ncbi:hypothetical protein [Vibrio crassostreae]|uniref:hypothetical protein n=1 Tax=Vibrio crassostreae TaxID=246167 RepID=UPI001B300851|nr:hypothetical protein [Vibrio crassostreae]